MEQIWNDNPVLVSLRNELPGGKCGACDFRYSCGGCRARALALHGELLAEDPKCLYVRPQGRLPEAALSAPQGSDVAWEPEAEERLQRIPAFVRGYVKVHVEKQALQQGMNTITAEFLASRRPPALAGLPR